ncbi:MAG TPA: hypothetical protein VFA28_02190 [Bryobacteraceae bacterium]|nr:hypothetical protein [Bryobacteraceae bacterium]
MNRGAVDEGHEFDDTAARGLMLERFLHSRFEKMPNHNRAGNYRGPCDRNTGRRSRTAVSAFDQP